MKITIAFIFLVTFFVGCLYFFTGYRSAFEADQQCHYQMRLKTEESDLLGCDHDLETKQWLLYRKGTNNQPSTVIERYRY